MFNLLTATQIPDSRAHERKTDEQGKNTNFLTN